MPSSIVFDHTLRDILNRKDKQHLSSQSAQQLVQYLAQFQQLTDQLKYCMEGPQAYLRDLAKFIRFSRLNLGEILLKDSSAFPAFYLVLSGELKCFQKKSEDEIAKEQEEYQYSDKKHFSPPHRLLANHAELFNPSREQCLYKLSTYSFKEFDCIGNLLNPNQICSQLVIASQPTEIAFLPGDICAKLFATRISQMKFIENALLRFFGNKHSQNEVKNMVSLFKESVVKGNIFDEGEESQEIFIVGRGVIVLTIDGQKVSELLPGKLFGHEDALSEQRIRTMTASTQGDSLCTIFRADLMNLSMSNSVEILRSLAKRGLKKKVIYQSLIDSNKLSQNDEKRYFKNNQKDDIHSNQGKERTVGELIKKSDSGRENNQLCFVSSNNIMYLRRNSTSGNANNMRKSSPLLKRDVSPCLGKQSNSGGVSENGRNLQKSGNIAFQKPQQITQIQNQSFVNNPNIKDNGKSYQPINGQGPRTQISQKPTSTTDQLLDQLETILELQKKLDISQTISYKQQQQSSSTTSESQKTSSNAISSQILLLTPTNHIPQPTSQQAISIASIMSSPRQNNKKETNSKYKPHKQIEQHQISETNNERSTINALRPPRSTLTSFLNSSKGGPSQKTYEISNHDFSQNPDVATFDNENYSKLNNIDSNSPCNYKKEEDEEFNLKSRYLKLSKTLPLDTQKISSSQNSSAKPSSRQQSPFETDSIKYSYYDSSTPQTPQGPFQQSTADSSIISNFTNMSNSQTQPIIFYQQKNRKQSQQAQFNRQYQRQFVEPQKGIKLLSKNIQVLQNISLVQGSQYSQPFMLQTPQEYQLIGKNTQEGQFSCCEEKILMKISDQQDLLINNLLKADQSNNSKNTSNIDTLQDQQQLQKSISQIFLKPNFINNNSSNNTNTTKCLTPQPNLALFGNSILSSHIQRSNKVTNDSNFPVSQDHNNPENHLPQEETLIEEEIKHLEIQQTNSQLFDQTISQSQQIQYDSSFTIPPSSFLRLSQSQLQPNKNQQQLDSKSNPYLLVQREKSFSLHSQSNSPVKAVSRRAADQVKYQLLLKKPIESSDVVQIMGIITNQQNQTNQERTCINISKKSHPQIVIPKQRMNQEYKQDKNLSLKQTELNGKSQLLQQKKLISTKKITSLASIKCNSSHLSKRSSINSSKSP